MADSMTPDKFYSMRQDDYKKRGSTAAGRIAKTLEANEKPGSIVVDIGCGNGIESNYLSSKGFCVIPMDFSREAVGYAKAMGISPILADATNIPVKDNSVDSILCSYFFCNLQESELGILLSEASRILVPGGRVYFSTHPKLDGKERDYASVIDDIEDAPNYFNSLAIHGLKPEMENCRSDPKMGPKGLFSTYSGILVKE